ncbi:tyrosinase family protein [Nocardiopsis sp. EMB25]|uniref:tyrosinase family protein n=1 Tax=Nocardiopsis sp. EMB25 TaxID=2835867 RepID=UPI0022842E10|nr:tyrosinase family protein [Nocardiopsis sp. EMB25]MCY9786764.1 tyrosinase family protein [Nocardiopsis sp. EMB25]
MSLSRRSLLLAGAGAVALGAGLPGTATAAGPFQRRRPALSPFVRQDVATLFDPVTGDWHPRLYWYARAVGWMKQRDGTPDRHDSWLFQWYTHGKPTPQRDGDPPEWRQCPHGDRYFLPWHRWYLYYFERIVRRVIVEDLGQWDQFDWALPYWNYAHREPGDGSEKYRRVPLPFRQRTMRGPDGREEENPLYLPPYDTEGRCRGAEPLTPTEVDPSEAMAQTCFWPPEDTPGASSGFSRAFEHRPHDIVHGTVGGLMGAVPTAAGDPVFWLHHCNIDRLWYAWMAADPSHTSPTGWRWPAVRPKHGPQDDEPFLLRDADGSRHVLEGDVFAFPDHAYEYDSLTDGTGTDTSNFAPFVVPPGQTDELAATTEEETRLAARNIVTLTPAPGGAEALQTTTTGDGGDERVLLTFEGVRATRQPCSPFSVLLGGDRSGTDPDGPAFVGLLAFFDNVGDEPHPEGRTFSFDVTEKLRELEDTSAWATGDEVPTVRVVADRPEALAADSDPRFARATLTVV